EVLVALEARRVGQHRQARRAAGFIGLGERRRIEVGADQAPGRRGLLDFGDERQAAGRVGPFERGAKAARRAGRLRARLDLGQAAIGLPDGDFFALVGGDAGEDVAAHLPAMLTNLSSAPWARPSSITRPASATPSRSVSAFSPTRNAAAAF